MKRVFLLGPPGSGKGTQAAKLEADLGLVHISSGALVRARLADPADPLGQQMKAFVQVGALVPAGLMERVVVERLSLPDCREKGFVLDGYPPSAADGENLVKNGIEPTHVIVLDCPDEVAVARQCARAERPTDVERTARHRLDVYHQKTAERDGWFPRELVTRVDASGSIDEVYRAVRAAVLRAPAPLPGGSYYLEEPPGPEKSTRFHSHIDARTHRLVRDIVAEVGARLPGAQNKVYPVTHLALGPQTKSERYAGLYARLPNFHPIDGAVDEAFVTGKMGEGGVDLDLLVASLEACQRRPHGRTMVEVEENLFEQTLSPGGEPRVVYHHPFTARSLDDPRLSPFAPRRSPQVPAFEIHHGFDVPKGNSSAMPVSLDRLMGETVALGLEPGGWFVFGKEDRWAYRSNEFSDDSYDESLGRTREQSRALAGLLARLGLGSCEVTSSLEAVLGVWCG